MELQIAPSFAGKSFTFMSPTLGRSVVVDVNDDGTLAHRVMIPTPFDGDGNELVSIEIDHPVPGEPAQHFFLYEDGIPEQYLEFQTMIEVEGEMVPAVPARYVRGVHMVTLSTELDEEIANDLLSDSTWGPFIRPLSATAADEVAESSSLGERIVGMFRKSDND